MDCVTMTFEVELQMRSAEVYADFLLPLLTESSNVLDCGTGSGSIAVGLASHVNNGRVTGIDIDHTAASDAEIYCRGHGIDNVEFQEASVYDLPFANGLYDVVFSHSMFELIDNPERALSEINRVLRPNGTVAIAAVEYSGLILSGPHPETLRKFYAVREQVWRLMAPQARSRIGQDLRGMLIAAGFRSVQASATYISHGDDVAVKAFGQDRVDDCHDQSFIDTVIDNELLSHDELEKMRVAWLEWATSPNAFAAFSWCRVVGKKSVLGA
jgi:ubiquinone/menaquinone biosynthesis C-methylase UbiE